jgi:pantetheine-phosphate adenylyltransferase
MRKALFPGSFDPMTLGHLSVVRRLAGVFDEVTVLVADALKKSYFFSRDERVRLAEECVLDLPNVKVDQFRGLTTDYAKKHGIRIIVRSLRGTNDFDLESSMALANRKLASDIETLFVMADPQFVSVSSTLVKEIAANGGPLSEFVTSNVAKAISQKL